LTKYDEIIARVSSLWKIGQRWRFASLSD